MEVPALQLRVLWHCKPTAPNLVVMSVVWFPVLHCVKGRFAQYTGPEGSGAEAYPARLRGHFHADG